MVSCLILYHATITGLTKCTILRAVFHEEDFEIHVSGNNTVILIAWNVKKEQIWQTVADFESTNIKVGYGFGEIKADAEKEAVKVLKQWLSMDEKLSTGLSTT